MALDMDKLHEFLGKALVDFGATFHAALVRIGDKLGLYKGLAAGGPQTAAELAKRTGTTERYVREWLSCQAAGGYVSYDAPAGKFYLTEEQAFAMADETSPAFMPGAFQVALAATKAEEELAERFKTGKGMGWHEHHHELFEGTERFFRPGYAANLLSAWIPALEGVEEKLKAGARVADVGCGLGASTILMAKAYPKSEFYGFDYHDKSIEKAKQRAKDAGVGDKIHFDVAMAKTFPAKEFDFVTFFDCLHDMGDPAGASAHVKSTMKKDGTWMIVEPMAGDKLEDNLNPIGRAFYGASTLLCTPASLSQEVGAALGAQAGEKRLKDVVTAGGFTRFRRATQTPFNLIFEARP
ncbi:MAG TPA: class I SAM-dependent methyltransferase [Candidatus Dormibacteraeota bacterium]|jgi:2-polyprenyl-3-methyl-5-hydroxy-6-metoxy-1,4-benzoquinol methylase|nr:class I SAM-dependent methyltransferase [Candidatus Dormibacteraeota bacterium]